MKLDTEMLKKWQKICSLVPDEQHGPALLTTLVCEKAIHD
jgi:hypothetical protein